MARRGRQAMVDVGEAETLRQPAKRQRIFVPIQCEDEPAVSAPWPSPTESEGEDGSMLHGDRRRGCISPISLSLSPLTVSSPASASMIAPRLAFRHVLSWRFVDDQQRRPRCAAFLSVRVCNTTTAAAVGMQLSCSFGTPQRTLASHECRGVFLAPGQVLNEVVTELSVRSASLRTADMVAVGSRNGGPLIHPVEQYMLHVVAREATQPHVTEEHVVRVPFLFLVFPCLSASVSADMPASVQAASLVSSSGASDVYQQQQRVLSASVARQVFAIDVAPGAWLLIAIGAQPCIAACMLPTPAGDVLATMHPCSGMAGATITARLTADLDQLTRFGLDFRTVALDSSMYRSSAKPPGFRESPGFFGRRSVLGG